jgi:hypothetical protein
MISPLMQIPKKARALLLLVAMLSLAFLEGVALLLNRDGVMFSALVGFYAFVVGWQGRDRLG